MPNLGLSHRVCIHSKHYAATQTNKAFTTLLLYYKTYFNTHTVGVVKFSVHKISLQ